MVDGAAGVMQSERIPNTDTSEEKAKAGLDIRQHGNGLIPYPYAGSCRSPEIKGKSYFVKVGEVDPGRGPAIYLFTGDPPS